MDNKLDCRDWRARAENGTLVVEGTCTFPTTGYTVDLKPLPSGVNPWMAEFDAVVHEPGDQAAPVVTDVDVSWSGAMPCQGDCTEVDIRGVATIPVDEP